MGEQLLVNSPPQGAAERLGEDVLQSFISHKHGDPSSPSPHPRLRQPPQMEGVGGHGLSSANQWLANQPPRGSIREDYKSQHRKLIAK